MNIAYLILAHEQPSLLERLVRALATEHSFFFIHIDKKAHERDFSAVLKREDVIPAMRRFRVFWAGVNMVKATLSLMQTAKQYPTDFDYYVLLSGTDYPIKSNKVIFDTLSRSTSEYIRHYKIPDFGVLKHDHGGLDRIEKFFFQDSYWTNTRAGKALIPDLVSRGANRVLRSIPVKRSFPAGLIPYGGWQHMILTNYCVEYTLNFIEDNPQYLRFFRFAHVPDEIALQTIIINSPFKKYVVNYSLKYINYDRAPHYILDLKRFKVLLVV